MRARRRRWTPTYVAKKKTDGPWLPNIQQHLTANENPLVYYSLYGHVFKLAQAVKEGAQSVKGTEVLFRRVEQFDIVLKKTADDKYLNQVRDQQKDIPVCTLDDLRAADGVIFGSPTRYGNMTAQMKQLID